jgi:putative ABC transport system permease protein
MTIRDFRRQPGFFITNILSLSIGIAACLLIAGYVRFNRSYDMQSPNYKDTYRIQYNRWGENNDLVEFASASPTIGPVIKENFPEALSFARTFKTEGVFFNNDKFFKEDKVFMTESSIFEVLGIPIINGDRITCLDDPNAVAISKETARKYFGNENPIGKTLNLNKRINLTVTSVFKDLPDNMHMKADIFVSLNDWKQRNPDVFTNGWFYSGFFTYVKFAKGTDPEKINQGIADYIEREFGKDLKEYKIGMSFKLQPLNEIHLNSDYMHELEANGNRNSVDVLEIVGWFILIIAWVNFFNLTTIATIRKQKEMAIRKTNGASKRHLISQMLVWSGFINIFAVVMALGFFELTEPVFCRFTGIPENSDVWKGTWFPLTVLIAFIIGTFSPCIYLMTGVFSEDIVKVLKGSKTNYRSGSIMKKGLVTLQFIIGIVLIAATIGVSMQYRFLSNGDPGFSLNNILVVDAPVVGDSTLSSKYRVFAEEVDHLTGVQACAFSSVIPGQSNMFNRGGIYRYGGDGNDSRNYRVTETASDFFKVYNIHFVAGEDFTSNPEIDKNRVIVNANAAINLGFSKPEDAVNQKIIMEGRPYIVSGVVIDFCQRSAKESIEPQIFRYPQRFQGHFSINTRTPDGTLKEVGEIYGNLFPNNPFNAYMLKNYYNLQFEQEKQYSVVLILFSFLVVFITILGLVGLAAYTAEQRKKEIGIRKTLGATPIWLFLLMLKDYIWLCLIASIIALPIFFVKFEDWLSNFASSIQTHWGLFVIPIVVVLLISVITVWVQSSRIIHLKPR